MRLGQQETMSASQDPENPLSTLTTVKPGDGGPLHKQAEQRIRQLAAMEEFQAGALLPDEETMANRLGVSRGTARAALARLVQEGVLERRAGVGTRVAPRRAESGIRSWRSFSREMAAKGITVRNFSVTVRIVGAAGLAAQALRVRPGVEVLRLERVRGWNGKPVLVTTSWFHPRLKLTGGEDFTRPLYEMLEAETGVVPKAAHEELTAITANAALAEKLSVKAGAPLLLRRHTVSDTGGRPIQYAEINYVSARFSLTLDLAAP